MNQDRPGTLGTALFAFPTSRCPRHPDSTAPSSSRAHLAVGVGVGEWEGGGRVRGVSWGWGGQQGLKRTWLKRRERVGGRWVEQLSLKGQKALLGAGPGQIQEPVVPGEGFPLPFPVAAWSALP